MRMQPGRSRKKGNSMRTLKLNPLTRGIEWWENTRLRLTEETGAATAEYAIVIMAAVGFAGLLVVIMRSDEVRGILTDMIRNALAFAS